MINLIKKLLKKSELDIFCEEQKISKKSLRKNNYRVHVNAIMFPASVIPECITLVSDVNTELFFEVGSKIKKLPNIDFRNVNLDLSNTKISHIPDKFTCNNLILGEKTTTLGKDIVINGKLTLWSGVEHLPDNLEVNTICNTIYICSTGNNVRIKKGKAKFGKKLVKLGEYNKFEDLDIKDAIEIKELPKGLVIGRTLRVNKFISHLPLSLQNEINVVLNNKHTLRISNNSFYEDRDISSMYLLNSKYELNIFRLDVINEIEELDGKITLNYNHFYKYVDINLKYDNREMKVRVFGTGKKLTELNNVIKVKSLFHLSALISKKFIELL